jgi:dihydroneopterin aldolase
VRIIFTECQPAQHRKAEFHLSSGAPPLRATVAGNARSRYFKQFEGAQMSTNIRLAFDNLEARAQESAGTDPLDRIMLRDYVVKVEIGAFQSERGRTQRVRFNVLVEVQAQLEPVDDDVDRILSYDTITAAIGRELGDERLNLLETLAERIADRILSASQVVRVFIRIEKLDLGPGALGVEIVRRRDSSERQLVDSETGPALRPLVVFLSSAAIASPLLTGWIDALQAVGKPVILCVGAAEAQTPKSADPRVQRRIDLLAIEQNAWVLAGRDRRCVVMQTRTEIDWATRKAQIVVWAPAKIVLDAVDGAAPHPADALALAAWFTGQVEGTKFIVVGAEAPSGLDVPVSVVSLDAATLL